ncbi:MAG: hypothetical protein WCR58_05315 [Bacteroidales bacterium]|jgi:tetratricopeptide (TPR) repeat protein|nr:hypothetical protein [Bacteroidales bacterium]MCK9448448.1 hypothetical protein [Bacteroidales bacterium]MDD3701634.1 hypothetical protein [Bacteroidales bacterium]MDY0369777.1 hypothetical protein [Bacteroidales bacterium]
MKKIVLTLTVAFMALMTMAQKSERTSAYMYNKNGQYDKAREAIDKAIQHDKTKDDPKTWMYRGIIYLNIVYSETYADLDSEALEKSFESFQKAMELDPEDKGRQMVEILPRVDVIGQQYFSQAVDAFNENDFQTASIEFKKSFDVAQTIHKVDTLALLNAGLASIRGDLFDQALGYYNQLIELDIVEPDIFRNKAAAYRGLGQNEEMMETIKAGRERYPDDAGLMLEEINAYLAIGEGAKVVDNLKELVEQDPNNASIFFVLGTIYGDETNEAMFDLDTAELYYSKAIAVHDDYYDAIYNLGALYINESNRIQVEANDLPLSETKKYDEMTEQANEIIRKALPYLEKAYEIMPDNEETKQVLVTIYTRFNMDDKLKEISAE